MRMDDTSAWGSALCAAAAFCLASSFCYIVNDLRDKDSDRQHPSKKNRPIAAGRVGASTAVVLAVILLAASGLLAVGVSKITLAVLAGYVSLQLCYTFMLKHRALLDVICIAIGFVLRAACGAVAIGVAISPWLFICMFTLCLFMGFCKRYNEVVTIGDMTRASNHRPTLIAYTPQLLTHLIATSAGIAVVAFLMYGLNAQTVGQFGTNYFIYTLPVVVYAVFRFAMLSMNGAYADPTELILRDLPFQITIVVWMGLILGIIRWGGDVSDWLSGLY